MLNLLFKTVVYFISLTPTEEMNSLAKNFIGFAIGGTGALAYLGIKKPWKKAAEPESRTLVNQESADIQKTLTSTDEDAFGEVKAKESQQFLDEVAEPKKP